MFVSTAGNTPLCMYMTYYHLPTMVVIILLIISLLMFSACLGLKLVVSLDN